MASQVQEMLRLLEEDIVFGVLPARSRIVEERIADRFGFKRHTVREALAQLEDMGLVRRIPNRGALVSELTPQQVREIYELRELLETSAARRTVLPVAPDVTDCMAEIQRRHSAAIVDEDFRAVFHLNIEFHAVQFSACANRELERAIADYARKAHLVRAIRYGDRAHMRKVEADHWAIVEAMKGSDVERLVEIVRAHLSGTSEDYLRLYEIRHGKERALA